MYAYEDDEDEEGLVKLESAIGRLDRSSLELMYRVTNGLEVPVLLMTPLPRHDDGVIRGAPDRTYAYVDPEGTLQLTKRLWVVPEDIDVVLPEVPFATEVLPGKTFEERLTLALPIRVHLPYLLEPEEMDKKRVEHTATAGGIEFSIGYLVESTGPLRRGPAPRESGASLAVRYGVAAKNQRILKGGLLGIGVPVRDVKR